MSLRSAERGHITEMCSGRWSWTGYIGLLLTSQHEEIHVTDRNINHKLKLKKSNDVISNWLEATSPSTGWMDIEMSTRLCELGMNTTS
jgi:hypothetical protein